jgi:hypothetical protein
MLPIPHNRETGALNSPKQGKHIRHDIHLPREAELLPSPERHKLLPLSETISEVLSHAAEIIPGVKKNVKNVRSGE